MSKVNVSINIARPPQAVFSYMIDMNNMTKWTNMTRMDLDGPLSPGTKGSFDLPVMGRRLTFPFVVAAFEDARRWAIQVTSRLGLAFDYRLVPERGGTRIDQTIEVRPRGLLRVLGPMLARMMKGEEMGELRRLKAALESGAA